ncbi:hypothetical protein CDAR_555751, partial [Caerostris darwini]
FSNSVPRFLQFVPVSIINNKVCETWHRKQGINIRIHDEMMCAGYEYGGKDACQMMIYNLITVKKVNRVNKLGVIRWWTFDDGRRNVWYLIGIVSAGYSCAKQYQPGIYHKVSAQPTRCPPPCTELN